MSHIQLHFKLKTGTQNPGWLSRKRLHIFLFVPPKRLSMHRLCSVLVVPSLSITAAVERVSAHRSAVRACYNLKSVCIFSFTHPLLRTSIFSSFQYQGVLLNDKGVCFLVVYCERPRNNECCDILDSLLVLIMGTSYQRNHPVTGRHLGRCLPSQEGY